MDNVCTITAVYQLLPQLEYHLRTGDWGEVVKESRNILELFEKDVTQFIKKMVSNTTAMNEEKAGDLTQSIDKLYEYTSDLHHIVDQGKIKNVYIGGKEDAYMVYMLTTSLVNLLAVKFKKVVSNR